MPRFDDSFVPLLKSAMLQRMPECLLSQDDVDVITRETGLSASQIQRWAKNIRYYYTSFEEREKYLSKDDKKVCTTGQTRVLSLGFEKFFVSKPFWES
jgi:hypothetical protein